MKVIKKVCTASIFLLISGACFSQQPKLKIYGYFDLEAEYSNNDATSKVFTFDQHHLNIITIYHLEDRFRLFTEMEWEHGGTYESGGAGYGKIYLTRAWLEYKHSDAFKIQAGKILVPFGIYGVKYDATPTFLSSFLPNSVYGKHNNSVGNKERLYSKWLTGIQILGSLNASNWMIDYYLYFTNGRGPKPSEKDNNANKGIGGRLIVNTPIEPIRLGFSFYTDKDGNSYNTKQRALGFDFAFDYSNFLLETEFIRSRGEKVDTNNTPSGLFHKNTGFYVQGSYAFFDQLTPFARYDFFDPDQDTVDDSERILTIGLNYSISPKVYLKNEIHFNRYKTSSIKNYEMYVGSIAVAF